MQFRIIMILAILIGTTFAQTEDSENGIGGLLTELGFKGTADESGNYGIVIDFSDKRSQLVYLNPAVSDADSSNLIEIWAPVLRSSEEIDAATSTKLLKTNSLLTGGAFQIFSEDTGLMVIFASFVPATTSASQLDQAIFWVATIADEMEKVLTNSDEL